MVFALLLQFIWIIFTIVVSVSLLFLLLIDKMVEEGAPCVNLKHYGQHYHQSHVYTVAGKKRGHVIFDYNSRNSWWIFIIFIPLETEMNTPQSYVIYLLDGLMTS